MLTTIRNRLILFVAVVVGALLLLAPTINREAFSGGWVTRPLTLGLDLVGGVHLVYEVETDKAVKSQLQSVGNALLSDFRKTEPKIAALRAIAKDDGTLGITLFGPHLVEKAKDRIQQSQNGLEFQVQEDDQGRPRLVYSWRERAVKQIEDDAVVQALTTLRRRVDQYGVSEPVLNRVGAKRIMIQMPGVKDIEAVKRIIGSVARLEFRLLPKAGVTENTVSMENRDGGGHIQVEDVVQMGGDAVADARMQNPVGRPEISLKLTSAGASLFRDLTAANVGRQLAIILDGKVYSSPVINEPIPGGQASISGHFTVEEAKELGLVLRSGALPAPLRVVEERAVGPTLGAESIKNGVIAMLAGCLFVFVFMLIYYRKSGIVANVSLLVNGLLVFAILAAFGATLTLPGIAGIALTIGMAVDANVLIYERMREELRVGASRDAAVHEGFQKAFSAIADSNITTFISGVVLYVLGTGPIRGFAVTLCIGIVTTVFCATFVCRLMFDTFKLSGKEAPLSI
jgi:preprotein translocase subunit SecD